MEVGADTFHTVTFLRAIGPEPWNETNVQPSRGPKDERYGEFEAEAKHLIDAQCVLPAYEMVMKASHTFNLLDARGAISVTERAAYIGRVRGLAKAVAEEYFASRERLGFP